MPNAQDQWVLTLGADRTCQYGKLRRVIGRAYRGGQRKPIPEAGGQQEVFINEF